MIIFRYTSIFFIIVFCLLISSGRTPVCGAQLPDSNLNSILSDQLNESLPGSRSSQSQTTQAKKRKIVMKKGEPAYHKEFIVRFTEDVPEKMKTEILKDYQSELMGQRKSGFSKLTTMGRSGREESGSIFNQLGLIIFEENQSEITEIRKLEESGMIKSISPNWVVKADSMAPNDPHFSELWGLHNTGQTGGTSDVDIDALEAWNLTTGDSSVIVAVIDSGVDYRHEDLAGNMWVNINEEPGDADQIIGQPQCPGVCYEDDDGDDLVDEDSNGCGRDGRDADGNSCTWINDLVNDDDENGFEDDIHGYDFLNNDSDPMDDLEHGTHVAGTIGAVGNNGRGITGVAWNVKIMALKFLGPSGSGSLYEAIQCIRYAMENGAQVMNHSWSGGVYNTDLYDVLQEYYHQGGISVASAGNTRGDTLRYPGAYDNVVAVASINHHGQKAYSSNSGSHVPVNAPGVDILSTLPNNRYGLMSGTSMASPHVAGVAALLLSYDSDMTNDEVIRRITSGDQIPQSHIIGLRVNAYKALIQNSPGLYLTTHDYSVSEGLPSGQVQVQVDRWGSEGTLEAYLNITNGTVDNGTDQVIETQVLTWYEGDGSPQFINLFLEDDLTHEPDMTLTVEITHITGGTILGINPLIVDVFDDDEPRVQFNEPTYPVDENIPGAEVVITVNRLGESTDAVSVQYETRDGSAQYPEDYSSTNGELTWLAGENQPQNIHIPIQDDIRYELQEDFYVALINPSSGLAIDGQNPVPVIIQDNDTGIRFGEPNYTFFEDVPLNSSSIEIVRVGSSVGEIELTLRSVDGTALEGLDYHPIHQQLIWPEGDSRAQYVSLPIINDSEEEEDETLSLVLENISGGSIVVPNPTSVIIKDEDSLGEVKNIHFEFSTFFGNQNEAQIKGVATTLSGEIILYGNTTVNPSHYPSARTMGPLGGINLFIAGLSREGSELDWLTLIGGTEEESAMGQPLVASNGTLYLVGHTRSPDFPLNNPLSSLHQGDTEGFIMKLNSDGSEIISSTFFGGAESDFLMDIELDESGHVYICGGSSSDNLPGSLNSHAGSIDGFFGKLTPDLNEVMYIRYIGTSSLDLGFNIEIDSENHIFIGNTAQGPGLPVTPGPSTQPWQGGRDLYLAKFNEQLDLIWGTYFGGSEDENNYFNMILSEEGNLHIAGHTSSSDIPVISDGQAFQGGIYDAFMLKMDGDGVPLFSTYLGGDDIEELKGLHIDEYDNMYVFLETSSFDLLVTPGAYQSEIRGTRDTYWQIYNADNEIVYATYLGGSQSDQATAVTLDKYGDLILVGATESSDWPVSDNPFQRSFSGDQTQFITKFEIDGNDSMDLANMNKNVQFGIGSIEIVEDNPTLNPDSVIDYIEIPVQRVNNITGPLEVWYTLHSRSAVEGEDFHLDDPPHSLSWSPNNSEDQFIRVYIEPDGIQEETETFEVELTTLLNGWMVVGPNPITISILDDDDGLPKAVAGIDQTFVDTWDNRLIDAREFNLWNAHKFTAVSHDNWNPKADFDCNGTIDTQDFNLWNASKFTDESNPNFIPEVADIGRESLELDGSGSYDSNGTILNFEWVGHNNGRDYLLYSGPLETVNICLIGFGVHDITLTVLDDEGNTDRDHFEVNFLESPSAGMDSDYSRYPGLPGENSSNPSNSHFHVLRAVFNPAFNESYEFEFKSDQCQEKKVDIYDRSGKNVAHFRDSHKTSEWDGKKPDGSSFPAGLYYLFVKCGDQFRETLKAILVR